METESVWDEVFRYCWILASIILIFAILAFTPTSLSIVKNFLFFLAYEIKASLYTVYSWLSLYPTGTLIRFVPIDASLVNTPKNGWSFANCPNCVWLRWRLHNCLEIEVGSFQESCTWYCYPCMDFCIGKSSGRIKKIIVKYQYIRNRGQWFRTACGETDWAKYFTSVTLAHIEILKFSQRKRSHHPTLVSRIFKQYGENFFQEVS
jgi:hypothetical protein